MAIKIEIDVEYITISNRLRHLNIPVPSKTLASMAAMNPNLVYNLDGSLDMRCRKNREWLAEENKKNIKTLREQIAYSNAKTDLLETRVLRQNNTIKDLSGGKEKELDPDDYECAICMEPMQGKVSLRCGHEMCPDCFARHARVNNTCPFCREEFSCKPKRLRETMSDTVSDAIVEQWSQIINDTYFSDQCNAHNNKETAIAKEQHLRWLVVENAKIIIKTGVRAWYETEV